MNDLPVILNFLFSAVCCGLFGLAMMTAVIRIAAVLEPMTISPVQAIGSVFTGSIDSARFFGWSLHVVASIAFGMFYLLLLYATTPPFTFLYLPLSATIGAAHGFIVFFLLIPTLAEHHRIKEVRDTGTAIGAIYILAHIAYGIGVGAMFLLLR